MSTERFDIHTHITDQIVAAIEAGAGEFKMPWHRDKGSLLHPMNIASGKGYQGINILSLWVAAEARGFATPIWGTYKQWQAKGAQVRKGERGSAVVFYKELDAPRTEEESGEEAEGKRLFARASWVFNASQVDGFETADATFTPNIFDPSAAVEALLAASGADIRYGGDRAYYNPGADFVQIPEQGRFHGTETMSASEAYDATRLHEIVHWSGAKPRLDRDFGKRFGDHAYAFEELVAELGSAYLCAQLGVTPIARADHAQYLAHWLNVMKEDRKAIFTAASQADKAARYLLGFHTPAPDPSPPTRPAKSIATTVGTGMEGPEV